MFQWMSKKLNQKRKGFTLIELIVVIAILGILAAIAIPRLTGTRDKAETAALVATVRTLNSAVSVYMAGEEDTTTLEGATDATAAYNELVAKDYVSDTVSDTDLGKITWTVGDLLFSVTPPAGS